MPLNEKNPLDAFLFEAVSDTNTGVKTVDHPVTPKKTWVEENREKQEETITEDCPTTVEAEEDSPSIALWIPKEGEQDPKKQEAEKNLSSSQSFDLCGEKNCDHCAFVSKQEILIKKVTESFAKQRLLMFILAGGKVEMEDMFGVFDMEKKEAIMMPKRPSGGGWDTLNNSHKFAMSFPDYLVIAMEDPSRPLQFTYSVNEKQKEVKEEINVDSQVTEHMRNIMLNTAAVDESSPSSNPSV